MNPLRFESQPNPYQGSQPIEANKYHQFKWMRDGGVNSIQSLCMELDLDRRTVIVFMTVYNMQKEREKLWSRYGLIEYLTQN